MEPIVMTRLTTPILVISDNHFDHEDRWEFVWFEPVAKTYYTEKYDAAMSAELYNALERGEIAWLKLASAASKG